MSGYSIPTVKSKYYPDYVEKMESQEGKTFVVTGTTTGTGYHLVMTILSKGGRVVALNRPSERVTKARQSILEKIPDAELTDVSCDLQSLESVASAAVEVLKLCETTGIDSLVCNAGIMAMPDDVTQDGFPIEMQTNHLSSFSLASKLLPALQKAASEKGSARITTHTSGARLQCKAVDPAHYAKVVVSTMTILQDKLEERGINNIICTCAAPGLAATNLQATTASNGGGAGLSMLMKFSQSAEDGTLPLLHAAISTDAVSGDYFNPGKKGMLSFIVKDGIVGPPAKRDVSKECAAKPENKQACWEASETAVGPFFPA